MGGNTRKQSTWWLALVQGLLLSLGVYLAAAALAGAALCGARSPWGRFPGAAASTGAFLAVIAAVGLSCWEEPTLLGRGGILLLCGAAGGLLAGGIGRRRPRRKGGVRSRQHRRREKTGP